MKLSSTGLALIKKFEGCRLKAYRDAVGVWTIGYGHTAMAGGLVPKAGVKITQREADMQLIIDLAQYERAVLKSVTRVPSQSQFDAMTSLCFNIGPRAFAQSSVLRLFNDGKFNASAAAFLRWNRAGGKILPGLTKRRAAERALFMTASPIDHVSVSPSPRSETTSSVEGVPRDTTAAGGAGAGTGAVIVGGGGAAIAAGWPWQQVGLVCGVLVGVAVIAFIVLKMRRP